MRIIHQTGREDLATVFVAQCTDGSTIEFVESVQPPVTRDRKWVIIISTLKGCPIRCPICDAGGAYRGPLSADELVAQVELAVASRYPDGEPQTDRLKIQFARMGDPALNPAVIPALEALHARYGERLWPSISTIAPHGCDEFFEALVDVRDRLFPGRFQMQFSLHTTDEQRRRKLIPARSWSFARMARWGEAFHSAGGRKVTLNFATPEGFPLDATELERHFSPDHFLVKLTPVNPTNQATTRRLAGTIDPRNPNACQATADRFRQVGFDVIVSIGELEENRIGSNCGMYVSRLRADKQRTTRSATC